MSKRRRIYVDLLEVERAQRNTLRVRLKCIVCGRRWVVKVLVAEAPKRPLWGYPDGDDTCTCGAINATVDKVLDAGEGTGDGA